MTNEEILRQLDEILYGTRFDGTHHDDDGLNDAKCFGELPERYHHQLDHLRDVRDQIAIKVEHEQTA